MTAARVIFSTGSLYPLDTSRCFELAAEAGFDGVEIMCDERFSTRDPDYLRSLSQQFDLPILVVHTPFSEKLPGWNGANKKQVERITCTLQLAEQLGAESMVVHVPRKIGWGKVTLGGKQMTFPWITPFMAVKGWIEFDLPVVQQKTAVKIALENLPVKCVWGHEIDPTWWNDVESWSQVHQWLTLDTTHWATKCISPLTAYQAAKGRVCHIHLSNYDGREHRLPHRGHLDLANFLRILARDGFTGTVCNELSPDALEYHDPAALRQHLKDSVAFCRENLN